MRPLQDITNNTRQLLTACEAIPSRFHGSGQTSPQEMQILTLALTPGRMGSKANGDDEIPLLLEKVDQPPDRREWEWGCKTLTHKSSVTAIALLTFTQIHALLTSMQREDRTSSRQTEEAPDRQMKLPTDKRSSQHTEELSFQRRQKKLPTDTRSSRQTEEAPDRRRRKKLPTDRRSSRQTKEAHDRQQKLPTDRISKYNIICSDLWGLGG